MRFGKRKNTLAALGRRLFGKQQEPPPDNPIRDAGLVQEERDALLDSRPYQHNQTPYLQDMETSSVFSSSIDPIQQLWVKLGHFSRQLSRAQAGAGATGWDDQAMADLVESLEIALNNDMQMICTPLIDVGRVLASYRAAGKPDQCLSFLFEAYDQLSIIAGDVVVGTVSEAVQRRWEELYDVQVRRMREEGIPLVEDDEDEEEQGDIQEPAASSPAVPEAPNVTSETEEPASTSPANFGSFDTDGLTSHAVLRESRAEQDFFAEVDQAMEQMADTDEDKVEDLPLPPPDESFLSTSGWQSVMSEMDKISTDRGLSGPMESPAPPACAHTDDSLTPPSAKPVQVSAQSDETVSENNGSEMSSDDHPIMSAQTDNPEPTDQSPQIPPSDQPATTDNLISFPDTTLENSLETGTPVSPATWTTPPKAEATENQIPADADSNTFQAAETTEPEPGPLSEKDEPMRQAGSEESVQAVETPTIPARETPRTCDLSETLPSESGGADTVARKQEDPIEAINQAVQEAILAGNIAEARIMAIRLAAALARREVEHAEQAIAETTLELENNHVRIEEACRREQEAEERVARVEAQITERREDQAANRQHLMEIDSDIQSRQTKIEELEAQIRRLQELRSNELEKLRDKELERESVLARDSLLDAELSALDAEEEAARDFLSDARDRLAHLRTEREKLEVRLAEWQQERDRRAHHVEEIEAPLHAKTPPLDSGEPSASAT